MADKKVRITEEVLSDYTGHMFGVPFVNSVSANPVSERRQARMLAALRGEVIDAGQQSGSGNTASSGGSGGSGQQKVAINGIYMNPASTGLKVGESRTLTYNTAPDNATDKSGVWSTNNAAIVTVDQKGKITAVGVGNAVVTFTSNDGPSSTCQVAVTAA